MSGRDEALRQAVRICALSLGMRCRLGMREAHLSAPGEGWPEAHEIAGLRVTAGRLAEGDPLREAVLGFAEKWTTAHRDPAALSDLGGLLVDTLSWLARPAPVGLDRRDIYG